MREAVQIKSLAELPVTEILIEDRLRPVSEKGVAALLASIEALGVMKDPIQVRKVKHRAGALVLIAGGHRLEAARRLSWETIPATVWDCTDDWARLMEIDDNVAGAELSVVDTAVFLAERKDVYERIHPETRQGSAGGRAKNGVQTDTMSVCTFSAVTAEKFGISERHVRRLVTAGAAINRVGPEKLRGTSAPVTLADLMAFAKMAPDHQSLVAMRIASGSEKTIRAARRQLAEETGMVQAKAPRGGAAQMVELWGRANQSERRSFVETLIYQIAPMVDAARARREAGE